MTIDHETTFLIPGGTFFVGLALYSLVLTFLVLWPLVGAVTRRQWGWLVMIVLFGPFAGVLWFVMGRPASNPVGEATAHLT